MFREMRRKGQLMENAESVSVLENAQEGVLAVIGDEGYPYTVPLNFVYSDGKIYFHCAKTGHKIDAITSCNKVSFCVIGRSEAVPKAFATHFKSVVAFGRASVVGNKDECCKALELLIKKYSMEFYDEGMAKVAANDEPVAIVRIDIEHMTGKGSNEKYIENIMNK